MSSESTTTPSGRLIVHNEAAHRFETTQDGHLCVLDYSRDGSVAEYYHTGVPAPVGGRGIAADLAQVALTTARARGWRVIPSCSYVEAYIQRHPEFADIVER